MAKSAQKINTTTQKFIEIQDIIDNTVLLPGNQACMVMEITATNFSLQSMEEQQIKIFSYASFLNSLSFPIQILIVSRRLDISSYIHLLDAEAKKTTNPLLSKHILLYKDFVANLIQKETVLDKKFYIVITYSFLEKGAGAVANIKDKNEFAKDAKVMLLSKSRSIIQELGRVGLKSKILEKNELIKLYYEAYNEEAGRSDLTDGVHNPFVSSSAEGGSK